MVRTMGVVVMSHDPDHSLSIQISPLMCGDVVGFFSPIGVIVYVSSLFVQRSVEIMISCVHSIHGV